MPEIINIILKDFKHVRSVAKGIGRGAIQGVYTPFLMNTGIEQFIDEFNSDKEPSEIISKNIAQYISACATSVPLAYEIGTEYFMALVGGNTIDYLINVYKRSRKK